MDILVLKSRIGGAQKADGYSGDARDKVKVEQHSPPEERQDNIGIIDLTCSPARMAVEITVETNRLGPLDPT